MTTKTQKPSLSPHGQMVEAERQARLAAELRANLRRRKAQEQARSQSSADGVESPILPKKGPEARS